MDPIFMWLGWFVAAVAIIALIKVLFFPFSEDDRPMLDRIRRKLDSEDDTLRAKIRREAHKHGGLVSCDTYSGPDGPFPGRARFADGTEYPYSANNDSFTA